jgi:hypothetical protein
MKKETKKSKAYRERVISIDKAKEIDNWEGLKKRVWHRGEAMGEQVTR